MSRTTKRIKYVLKESSKAMIWFLVGSLFITGFILLVGHVFKQDWAFSSGLLFVAFFWHLIKSIRKAIKESKYMQF